MFIAAGTVFVFGTPEEGEFITILEAIDFASMRRF